MWFRIIPIAIVILLFSCKEIRQPPRSLSQDIVQIDSLILCRQFGQAKLLADSLHDFILDYYTGKEQVDLELRVRLLLADIFVKQSNVKEAITLVLSVIDQAQLHNLPQHEYQGHLIAALIYELLDDLASCNAHLDHAYSCYQKNRLDHLFSTYCIRRSSYYRFAGDSASAIAFAYKALTYSKKFDHSSDIADSYLLLGILLDGERSVSYNLLAAKQFLTLGNREGTAMMYHNISRIYSEMGDIPRAFIYSDSSLHYDPRRTGENMDDILELRSILYEKAGQVDSAYYYYQKYHTAHLHYLATLDAQNFKVTKDKYEIEKREAIIKSKNQQMILIGSLLAVILIGSVLLILKNRKINSQNKIINKQVSDVSKMLEQKRILLSELQHRVKNNLQHVISILDIQKESVDFSTIDELIRSNQNRIHSMALLHKKLNVDENVSEVNLRNYIAALATIVKESYDDHEKDIHLTVSGDIGAVSIDVAMPLGLIIVELVSNSMKYAFKEIAVGLIHIEIEKANLKNALVYSDNGIGFDFYQPEQTGLGLEIIKGLIDQLDAVGASSTDNGFELTLIF
ncbi:sensor histidine kinase [Sphingobacterium faecale]|uniref:histidine kinase n=1 Tax=Sphingobacterium faecale TaxID=2803775 RepID=A0ABS1R2E0_9SPHI|nr:sensor histidine kinase [Sphingobacterium faecale]MBL1408056.1 sensor histidine kinase [Sphingobacterium faecale]